MPPPETGFTTKGTLLTSAPLGVVTCTVPLVAPVRFDPKIKVIRRDHRHVRLILMVESCDRKMAMDALAGARGIFRAGEQPFKMLCKCISTVHGGQVWASADQLECLLQVVSQTSNLRIPAHRLPASTSQHLTDREGEVVRLVAEGLSNKEISAELKISEHTVKRHLV